MTDIVPAALFVLGAAALYRFFSRLAAAVSEIDEGHRLVAEEDPE